MMIGWMVGSTAVYTQLFTRNVAGLLDGTIRPVLASRFSTRRSPPTVKQAAPALRLPAGEADGLEMFLATLHTRVPMGVFGGRLKPKFSVNAAALLTLVKVTWPMTA